MIIVDNSSQMSLFCSAVVEITLAEIRPMNNNQTKPDETRRSAAARTELAVDARQISSTELLAGRREVLIAHEGELCRLRLTRSNELILHK